MRMKNTSLLLKMKMTMILVMILLVMSKMNNLGGGAANK
jgi:hypothetical protein